jgi:hypothetical protein
MATTELDVNDFFARSALVRFDPQHLAAHDVMTAPAPHDGVVHG